MHTAIDHITTAADVRPFLRWAGSKRRLLKHLLPYIPTRINTYFEPFLGGGAMFFFLGPNKAVLSDRSSSLIETYKAARRHPDEILTFLKPLKPDKPTFDKIRHKKLITPTAKAGAFIFLNKACWNGLYRVNSQGIFNVPYGYPKTDFLIDETNFRRCSTLLRKRSISIRNQDFAEIEQEVAKGDFVFMDPPYVTAHNMNGFADWNESLFSWADQIRLAQMARSLAARGANVLITNADHPSVHELYQDFGVATYTRSSTLAGDMSKRGTTSEAIFFKGPAYPETDLPRNDKSINNKPSKLMGR